MKGVTPRQLQTMLVLRRMEVETEKLVDLDQLLAGLPWNPSKESAQFVIRALVTKGMIEKAGRELRRGRARVCFKTTENGLCALDPTRVRTPVPVATEKRVEPGAGVETEPAAAVELFDPGSPGEEFELE